MYVLAIVLLFDPSSCPGLIPAPWLSIYVTNFVPNPGLSMWEPQKYDIVYGT